MKKLALLLLAALVAGAALPEGETRILRYSPEGPPGGGMESNDDEKLHVYYTSERNERITSGVWEATRLMSEPYTTKYSEFIYLLDGSLTLIDGDGQEEIFHAGDAALIPRGMTVTWKQPDRLRKYYVIFDHEADATSTAAASESTRTIMRLHPDGPPGGGLKGEGQTISHRYYAGSRSSSVGVWETAPHEVEVATTRYAELMIFLKGSVTLIEPDGEQTFGPGDVALVPKGAQYKWKSDTVRKYWVIFDNAPSAARGQ